MKKKRARAVKPGPWWKEGVIYQVYPRSFRDSNGDGVGDIPGVIEKLDYLADLGVDGIWLSPINTSPMFDFGYDVSDYRAIDPVFGTLKDFDRLVKEAHRRRIRIVMDLVMNHTSHLHPWFVESRSSKQSPKRDWYIWRDAVKGKEPNNWMAYFGGRAWEWDDATGQYYLHSFLKEQPDLNWRNPAMKKAAFAEIRFWLDRGVDGFRLDVVNFFVKDDRFRSNPFAVGRYPRPYDLQRHMYDRDRPELKSLLCEWRALLDGYRDRMMVGEIVAEKPDRPAVVHRRRHRRPPSLVRFLLHEPRLGRGPLPRAAEGVPRRIPGKGWPALSSPTTTSPQHVALREARRRGEGARIVALLLHDARHSLRLLRRGDRHVERPHPPQRDAGPGGEKYWPFNGGRTESVRRCSGPRLGAQVSRRDVHGSPWAIPVARE